MKGHFVFRYARHASMILALGALVASPCWSSPQESGTSEPARETLLDALSRRAVFHSIALSPDGRAVAFLVSRALARVDAHEFALRVVELSGPSAPVLLARYAVAPDASFKANSGETLPAAGEFHWSADSETLLFTTHDEHGMQLRLWDRRGGKATLLLAGHREIQLGRASPPNAREFVTMDPAPAPTPGGTPHDKALRVKDEYRFYGPLENPKTGLPTSEQRWVFDWTSRHVTKLPGPARVQYVGFPGESTSAESETIPYRDGYLWPPGPAILSPDGKKGVHIQSGVSAPHSSKSTLIQRLTMRTQEPRQRVLAATPAESDRLGKSGLGWSPDSRQHFFIERRRTGSALLALSASGALRTVYEAPAQLSTGGRACCLSGDARTAVLVRSTNASPDELVKLDLRSGVVTSLFAPNADLAGSVQNVRASVRFIALDDLFYGRLYLPPTPAKGLPLVFTLYTSRAGFEESVGDEVPIYALVQQGIAVFTLNAREAAASGNDGDLRWELLRVDRPRQAMERVVDQLADEGIVDRECVGLTGLSYGAEIASYSYWKSKIFRAVSAASSSWSPDRVLLAGVAWVPVLERRGFAEPNDGAYAQWKQLSAALNGRPDLPPLLWQSPDGEHNGSVETWFRLRRAGAQVEWWEYPGEGHVKRSPANRWWVYTRNLDWFRFWLKDEEDSSPHKAEQYSRWRTMRENWRAAAQDRGN